MALAYEPEAYDESRSLGCLSDQELGLGWLAGDYYWGMLGDLLGMELDAQSLGESVMGDRKQICPGEICTFDVTEFPGFLCRMEL